MDSERINRPQQSQTDRKMAWATGQQGSRDYDMARRQSDVDMIDPENCEAAKVQSGYRMDRNNSLEQYERTIHPERREREE